MTDTVWATTSCSSRAMRRRSWETASASLDLALAAQLVRARRELARELRARAHEVARRRTRTPMSVIGNRASPELVLAGGEIDGHDADRDQRDARTTSGARVASWPTA